MPIRDDSLMTSTRVSGWIDIYFVSPKHKLLYLKSVDGGLERGSTQDRNLLQHILTSTADMAGLGPHAGLTEAPRPDRGPMGCLRCSSSRLKSWERCWSRGGGSGSGMRRVTPAFEPAPPGSQPRLEVHWRGPRCVALSRCTFPSTHPTPAAEGVKNYEDLAGKEVSAIGCSKYPCIRSLAVLPSLTSTPNINASWACLDWASAFLHPVRHGCSVESVVLLLVQAGPLSSKSQPLFCLFLKCSASVIDQLCLDE